MSANIQSRNVGFMANPPMHMPIPVRPSAAATGMTAKEVFGIIRRHFWLILFFTVAGLILGSVGWFLLHRYAPKYTSQPALIRVLPQGITDPWQMVNPAVNKDIEFQHRNSKAELIRSQTMLESLLDSPLTRDRIRQTQWFQHFLEKTGGSSAEAFAEAVDDLKRHLHVVAHRDQEYIAVAMTCTGSRGKEECRVIANEMVDLFLQEQNDYAKAEHIRKLGQLTRQQETIDGELREANANLDKIRAGSSFANLTQARFRDYLDEKMADLETRFDTLESEKARLAKQVEILQSRAATRYEDYDAVVKDLIERDPIASRMRSQIADLEVQLAQLRAQFGEDHRRVREVRDAKTQAQADMEARQRLIGDIQRQTQHILANDDLVALTTEIEAKEAQLAQAREEHRQLFKVRADYEKALIVRDEKQTMLEDINEHIAKVRAVVDDPELSKLQKVTEAVAPFDVSSPMWYVWMPGGLLLGMLAGVGLAFAVELLNDVLRTPRELMRHVRAPMLGMICHEDEDRDLKGVDLYHVVQQAPYSLTSECYRQLRANLKLSGTGASQKVLLVTSCNPAEGKTSVAVNTTATLVADENRVLFVDANFRRPAAAAEFPQGAGDDKHPDSGLSNFLMGQCQNEQDIIRRSGVEGLDVIDSGPLPSNPAELLGGSRMRQLLDKARGMYDYVVIDGPPLILSDAKALASLADGTVLVFNATTTRRGAAQRAIRELEAIHANIVGTVLMGVRTMKGGYFNEVFRSYQDYQRVKVRQPV